ncbi:hypothetical protein ACFXPT_38195 [Streptomyces goshikiensis]|uniref:hypothetical protein n=1 Tax=Streptomyces goshikiensis TaxID=1942 RepID=UPI003699B369
MSTTRRVLGTGPRAESKVELWISAPRLLPAERAEQEQLLADDDEHQAVIHPARRRTLGTGPAAGAS